MWKTRSLIIAVILILLTLGVIMLASTSAAVAEQRHGNAHHFVIRQLVYITLSFVICVAFYRVPVEKWKVWCVPLAVFAGILLIMTLIPGVGVEVKGSKRWLNAGPVNFQPSELAKVAIVLLLSAYLAKMQRKMDEFVKGLVIPLAILGFFLGLIFIEPDYGTTLLMGSVGFGLLFLAGTRFSYLAIAGVCGASAFVVAVMQNPVRMRRIIAFLDPEKYAEREAFQLLNAIFAFITGGGKGVGLGQSIQKKFYLPEAHTDFIFAIIGEELGMVASLGVVILFFTLFASGMFIAIKCEDYFGRLIAFGVTLTITMQAIINIGVVTGVLPTKGLALPFMSYGGSHLLVSGAMIGILLSVASEIQNPRKTKRKSKDLW